jgi:hypothetical protein
MEMSEYLYTEVDNTARHLEELIKKRNDKIKDMMRTQDLEDEAEEVSFFLNFHSRLFSKCKGKLYSIGPMELFYFLICRAY